MARGGFVFTENRGTGGVRGGGGGDGCREDVCRGGGVIFFFQDQNATKTSARNLAPQWQRLLAIAAAISFAVTEIVSDFLKLKSHVFLNRRWNTHNKQRGKASIF